VKTHGFWFDRRVQTHAHRLSAQSVAEGTADIAALDIVTWHLIQRYDPFATSLRVLERTEPTPGLPYITAVHLPGDLIYKAVETAIAQLSTVDRATLGLQGIVPIPKQTYLDIPTPPIHEQSG
jgi:ABC-type phosphate/phosphonate transport system substrate-binding protein